MTNLVHEFTGKSGSELKIFVFLGILGLAGSLLTYFARRWWENRKPLSANAKRLFKRIKGDPTHEAKGLTLHFARGSMNYWTYRVLESDSTELGMFYEIDGEYLQVCKAVEELVQAKKLQLDPHAHSGLQIYSLT